MGDKKSMTKKLAPVLTQAGNRTWGLKWARDRRGGIKWPCQLVTNPPSSLAFESLRWLYFQCILLPNIMSSPVVRCVLKPSPCHYCHKMHQMLRSLCAASDEKTCRAEVLSFCAPKPLHLVKAHHCSAAVTGPETATPPSHKLVMFFTKLWVYFSLLTAIFLKAPVSIGHVRWAFYRNKYAGSAALKGRS